MTIDFVLLEKTSFRTDDFQPSKSITVQAREIEQLGPWQLPQTHGDPWDCVVVQFVSGRYFYANCSYAEAKEAWNTALAGTPVQAG
jgi:hypothetical protein